MAKNLQNLQTKKDLFLDAFKSTLGIVSQACEKVGISRVTFYDWCSTDLDFKSKVDEINDMQIDFVESKLLQNINKNDTTASIFYLKTKGKKRGWSEKANEDDETNNINLTVTFINDEN